MGWFESWLRRHVPYKELGWAESNEYFTRFQLLKTPWFNLYLHRLDARQTPVHCHDHPWHFWVLVLWGGYWEWQRGRPHWRAPGAVFYRPARTVHNTVTRTVNWSLILTSRRVRDWGFTLGSTCAA